MRDMEVTIKQIDKKLPLPKYETAGAVGFDFVVRTSTEIAPRSVGLIPANVIIQTPPGYMLLVTLRSSAPRKKGLIMPHGVGIIDQDYCGTEDEIKIQVYNMTDHDVLVERGERIAQGIFVRVDQVQWNEVDEVSQKTRGGFGATG